MRNIVENNKLIAEFMENLSSPMIGNSIYLQPFGIYGGHYIFEELEYHSSWNWLMPVVEKINEMMLADYGEIGVEIYPGYTNILCVYDEILIEGLSDKSFILQTYNTIVEFIKWYNEQNNK